MGNLNKTLSVGVKDNRWLVSLHDEQGGTIAGKIINHRSTAIKSFMAGELVPQTEQELLELYAYAEAGKYQKSCELTEHIRQLVETDVRDSFKIGVWSDQVKATEVFVENGQPSIMGISSLSGWFEVQAFTLNMLDVWDKDSMSVRLVNDDR